MNDSLEERLKEVEKELLKIKKEKANLYKELEDLQILHENLLDHSSILENDIWEQNIKMETLQKKMKKYLSPQLYEALLGGTADAILINRRKKLTIFFSDIVEFTDITDSIESELLTEILNHYLNQMANIAIKWGGTIDKFIGDAIMIFFGDPKFIDDVTHAKNCVKMALEMREELEKLEKMWETKGIPKKFKIRIGINTGYCTVGNFGSENRMDYTIIGGEVNLASRLESIAKSNSIYISSSTHLLVKDIVECEYVDKIKVKGIHHPIDVYEIIKLKKEEQGKLVPSSINITKNGFILDIIKFDRNLISKAKKQELSEVLKKALNIINND